LANGGRTLRVMEAPTPGWFAAIEEFAGPLREGASETTELPIQ
jgi:hypothetical protein